MIIDREEIESVLDYYFPLKLVVSTLPKDMQKEVDKVWMQERKEDIKICADIIARRIKERSEDE